MSYILPDSVSRLKPNVLYLLIWLIDNTDEEGYITMPGREMAKMLGMTYQEWRTAVCVARATQLVTQASTQAVTQGATQALTQRATTYRIDKHVCYRVAKNESNASGNASTNATSNATSNASGNAQQNERNASPLNNIINPLIKKEKLKKENEKKVFVRPTVDMVKAYALERGAEDINCEEFFDHYESNGWMVGKVKMKDWKAAFRNWCSKRFINHTATPPGMILQDTKDKHYEGW